MRIYITALLALSLATTIASAQDVSKVRALATLGGEDKEFVVFDYYPGDQRIFIVDQKGFTIWSLNGMQQLKDFRSKGSGYNDGVIDWSNNKVSLITSDNYYGDNSTFVDFNDVESERERALSFSFNGSVFTTKNGLNFLPSNSSNIKAISQLPSKFVNMRINSDTNLLLVTTQEKSLLYQVNSGQLLKTFSSINLPLADARFSPDESRVLLTDDNGLALYEIATGLRLLEMKSDIRIDRIQFSPDGKLIAYGLKDGTVNVLDTESGATVSTFKTNDGTNRIQALSFSRDSKILAAGSYQSGLNLWNPTTGMKLASLGKADADIEQLKFTWDGKYLLSASNNNTIQVWGVPNVAAFSQTAQLTLNSNTPGATVVIDGVPFGSLDASGREVIFAADAPHRLVLTAPGARPFITTTTLAPGETRTLTLNPVPLQGRVTFQSNPPGAVVIIDKKLAGKTPLTLERLPSGPLAYTLKYAGYSDFSGTVNLTEAMPVIANGQLKVLPGISVKSAPTGAAVFLNGRPYGSTPLVTSDLKPGAYTLTVKLQGYKDQTANVVVPANGLADVNITMKK